MLIIIGVVFLRCAVSANVTKTCRNLCSY